MSEITEKRTIKIPPCIVDKELIQEIGGLLQSEELCRNHLKYSLDSKTQDIESKKVEDFVKADWGSELNEIMIETDCESPKVRVSIDFRNIYLSEFSVSGKDTTWVNGVTNRIHDIFRKHRPSYHRIKTNWFLKMLLTIITTGILCYPIFLLVNPLIVQNLVFIVLILFPAGYGGAGLYFLIEWLFPYLEYGEPLQKRMRKWIWIFLLGSGLIPAIILKILGL